MAALKDVVGKSSHKFCKKVLGQQPKFVQKTSLNFTLYLKNINKVIRCYSS